MKGLILKDFLVITKQAKLFLLILLIFIVTASEAIIPFVICYTAMLPVTALAYDEQSKWNNFADMMPYSAFDMVFSKYLLGYIISLLVGLICVATQSISNIINGATALNEYVWYSTLLYISAALLIQAVNLPVMFRFGVEKGRLWFLIFTMLIMVLIAIAGDFIISTIYRIETISSAVLVASILIFTAAANVLSVFISTKSYQRKR